MRRVFRIALVAIALLGVVGWLSWRHLSAREPIPETTSYALDLAEIRRLAGSLGAERPLRVNYEAVGEAALPRAAVFAGESFAPQPFTHGAYQVAFAGRYGVIDSGFDEAMYQRMGRGSQKPFNADGYANIQRALGGAAFIVITHEHPDHLGGIGDHPEPEKLVGRLVLTRQQLGNTEQLGASKLPEVLRAIAPLDYAPYHALAPGVVLIQAAGHTPGSQLVFVQLASGAELLFVGDVAWHMDQIRELWYRPRWVTRFFLSEDRAAVMGQLRALHELEKNDRAVQIVVSHDIPQRDALLDAGRIGRHFEF